MLESGCWASGAARACSQVYPPGGQVALLRKSLFDPVTAQKNHAAVHLSSGVDPRLHVRMIDVADLNNPARGSYGLFAKLPEEFALAAAERERDGSRLWRSTTEDMHHASPQIIRKSAGSVLPSGSVLGEYVGELRCGSNRERLTGDFATQHSKQMGEGQMVYASHSATNSVDEQYTVLLGNTEEDGWQQNCRRLRHVHKKERMERWEASCAPGPLAEKSKNSSQKSPDGPKGRVTGEDYTKSLLYIDGRLHRNAIGFANDPSGEGGRIANAEAWETMVGGWPHMIIVSTRDILPGEEILWSYGGGFWPSDDSDDDSQNRDSAGCVSSQCAHVKATHLASSGVFSNFNSHSQGEPMEAYECEFDCGFEGSYEECIAHEATCLMLEPRSSLCVAVPSLFS